MANVKAQQPSALFYVNSASPSKAFANPCSNPSLIVVQFTGENITDSYSVSDASNGSYTKDKTVSTNNTSFGVGQGRANIFSVQNTSTSTLTVSGTAPAATYGVLAITELTGAATSAAAEATGQSTSISGGPLSISITTLSADTSIFMCGVGYSSPGTSPIDTGYTLFPSTTAGSVSYHFGEYNIDVATAQTYTLTFTGSGFSAEHQAAAVAYKTAGGATSRSVNANLNFPLLTLSAAAKAYDSVNANVTFGTLTLSAAAKVTEKVNANITFPLLTLSATAHNTAPITYNGEDLLDRLRRRRP